MVPATAPATRASIALATSLAAVGFMPEAAASDAQVSAALKAIEIYVFVLPAIDCYRDTAINTTTDGKALERLLNAAFLTLGDKHLARIKGAAVRGAGHYDDLVSAKGRQGYCEHVSRRYGPRGVEKRGLVIAKVK